MLNKLVELEKLTKVKHCKIPRINNEFAYSEIVAEVTYECGLNVIVLRLRNDYTITYEYDKKTWPGYFTTQEDVIDDVKVNLEKFNLKNVIPN